MSDNLRYFDLVKDTPADAQKPIEAGRLKNFTEISPLWRILKLTEVFGPCGTGWKYAITDKQFVPIHSEKDGKHIEEMVVYVSINLYYREGDGWSDAIPGEGGDMVATLEKGGIHIKDDAVKGALTDAIGNACQKLGMSYDIYSKKYESKYSGNYDGGKRDEPVVKEAVCPRCKKQVAPLVNNKTGQTIYGTQVLRQFGGVCRACYMAEQKEKSPDET